MAAQAINDPSEKFRTVEETVLAAVKKFSENYQSFRKGFGIFNPGKGLLRRFESVFDWDIYSKTGEKINCTFDRKEAAAAMNSMPKQGIVALNAYLEAFIHNLLEDTFDALYVDSNAKKLKLKQRQMAELTQPNWSGNLEIKLARFFSTQVKVHELLENILQALLKSHPLVWTWQFGDSTHRHKYLVAPRDVQTFADMANFFYGVRCIVAHGNPKKTASTGALKSDKPTCNYWVKRATNYIENKADKSVVEYRERFLYEWVETEKKFGYSVKKRKLLICNNNGCITKSNFKSKGLKPTGNLKMKQVGKPKLLHSFDKFLDGDAEREAVQALQQHCVDLWKKAKDDKLDVDYHLFLSIGAFNVYYAEMIALLCLGISYSVVHGNTNGFISSLPGLTEKLRTAAKLQ